jgi:DNA modification methylase
MQKQEAISLQKRFNGEPNADWAFPENRSINYLTHGYHRYPAKFIPQLVKRLIEDHTDTNDTIADLFAGCGTSLVEAKAHGRKSIGVDINPVAQLITRAKTNAIEPIKLEAHCKYLVSLIEDFDSNKIYYHKKHERIDYWFREEEKNKISFLYNQINKIKDKELKTFSFCALSNILKTCSKWLQSSTKPQIDPKKKIENPFDAFKFQLKKMQSQNRDFYDTLVDNDYLFTKCSIKLADARNTGIKNNSVGAIITSPPYVTSYEYADIHQLTGYWFNYFSDLPEFRRKFIGTFYSNNSDVKIKIPRAKRIIEKLKKVNPKIAREVANYFSDMLDVTKEMHRILREQGKLCVVIGNTKLRGVKIKSAEIFAEMLKLNGFEISEVIIREIPNKLLPTIRDKKTGRFTDSKNKDKKLVYPEEYIIIAQKLNVSE